MLEVRIEVSACRKALTSFGRSLKRQDLLQIHTEPGEFQKEMRRNFARAWVAVALETFAFKFESRRYLHFLIERSTYVTRTTLYLNLSTLELMKNSLVLYGQ